MHTQLNIETSLPRPWEEETTFNDVLYDWMNRAPWLAISAAAHVLALFVVAAFIGSKPERTEPPVITARMDQPIEELEPEPEPEVLEDVPEIEEPIEDPVLRDVEVDVTNQEDTNDPFREMQGESQNMADTPFENTNANDVAGIGGGAGSPYGGRGGYVDTMTGKPEVVEAIESSFEWLAAHQNADGSWDSDGFDAECGRIGDSVCSGTGKPQHDVGVTALALLTFLGAGNTQNEGQYQSTVSRGLAWLRDMQDPDTGLIGDKSNHEFLYDHSIATLALCEAYSLTRSPLYKPVSQRAVNYIHRARNYGSAWRYAEPGNGENDTSVTGWMVFALKAAQGARLDVDPDAFAGAESWFDEVTDKTNGRAGYLERGSYSSRVTGVNDSYPADKGEAMTAVALLSRVFMGQDPGDVPMLEKHADLMGTSLPAWDPDGLGNDMYYWYYGTYAMFQMGGKHWRRWESTILPEIVAHQSQRGDEKGSWDPNGPWGHAGGRVYSTAMLTLALEVYFRYPHLTGSK